MKKALLIIICTSIFLFSCGRKNEAPKQSGITVNIDGTNKSYTLNPYGFISDDVAKGSHLFIAASIDDKNNTAESIGFEIKANAPITKGTYHNDNSNGYLAIIYFPADFNELSNKAYVTDLGGSHISTVTITSITNNNVQGTFSGELIREDNTLKTVTNGKFNFAIQQK